MISRFIIKLKIVWRQTISFSSEAIRALVSYLNGPVRTKYLGHPIFRWLIVGLIVFYILIGLIVSHRVYVKKSESDNIARILNLYPLPAVLMKGDVILVKDYLTLAKFIRNFEVNTKSDLPDEAKIRQQVLDRLIDRRIANRLIRQYGLRVTRQELDERIDKQASEFGGLDELKRTILDLYGMSLRDYRIIVRDTLMRDKIRTELIEQVKTQHILVTDEKKANELLKQLQADPNKFGELAKQFSIDESTKEKAGERDWLPRGAGLGDYETLAFETANGELASRVAKSTFGYHIIKTLDKKGNIQRSLDEFIASEREKERFQVLYK